MTTSACDWTENYATWPNATMETMLNPTKKSFHEVHPRPSSLEFHQPSIFNQYIEMSLLSAIMAIGILGNILVLVVHHKNRFKKQSTANYFLCSLIISDLIVCISVIPLHLYLEVTSIYRFIKDVECQISLFIWNQTLLCSSWILVGISIDRYLAIRYPLETKIDAKRAKFIVVCIWAMSVIVASPSLMIFVGPRCTLMETTAFPLFFTAAILHSLIAMYIPLVIIIAAYLKIFYLLSMRKKHSKWQIGCQKLINNTRTTVAKRLFLVIIVYIICWQPRAVLKIYSSFTADDIVDSNSRELILYLMEYFLPYLNSLLNPILYFMINKSFRRQCKRIVCCYYRCVCCRAERTAYKLQKTSILLRINSSFKNTTFRNLPLK